MPSSIAARTSSQPPDCAAALAVATTTMPSDERPAAGQVPAETGEAGAPTRHRSRLRRGRRRRRAAQAGRRDGRPRPRARRRAPLRGRPARGSTAAGRRRCTVRPASAGRSRPTRSCSVCVSTAESGSSRTITRVPAISARASATRWRWPPERFTPRSPISVSYPFGRSRHEVGDAGGGAHRLHLVPWRVGPAGDQVLAQRDREQDRPLGDHRDVCAQRPPARTSRRSTPPRSTRPAVGS